MLPSLSQLDSFFEKYIKNIYRKPSDEQIFVWPSFGDYIRQLVHVQKTVRRQNGCIVYVSYLIFPPTDIFLLH